MVKTYPYNRASAEGRRLFKLLGSQFNPSVLTPEHKGRSFDTYEVPSILQCRVNKVGFIFTSNLSGLKRPQIQIDSDAEMAWGEFTDDVSTLDFTHGNDNELPLSYIQPLEDDTLKMLIDAGLYRDPQFEALMSKLMKDEMFDAEADISVSHLEVGLDSNNEHSVPVLMVDPVSVVHNEHDPSERTTIADLVKRSTRLAIALRKEGVKTEELVSPTVVDLDREVFMEESFIDVVTEHKQAERDSNKISTSSELLDTEVDVTEALRGSLSLEHTSEDDKIRDLKDSEDWNDQVESEDDSIDWDDSAESEDESDDLDEQDDFVDEGFPDISDGYDYEGSDDVEDSLAKVDKPKRTPEPEPEDEGPDL